MGSPSVVTTVTRVRRLARAVTSSLSPAVTVCEEENISAVTGLATVSAPRPRPWSVTAVLRLHNEIVS